MDFFFSKSRFNALYNGKTKKKPRQSIYKDHYKKVAKINDKSLVKRQFNATFI